jgi:DNA-binding CsgD family transcriptional regulator/tetratricopeptide (TPR) repeat protein
VRAFIGRDSERARLADALAAAQTGRGSLLLVSGEAGVGKTRVVEEVLGHASGTLFIRGVAATGGAPFGPVVAALRSFLRSEPDGLADCGPLRAHLALLLPELGDAQPTDDRATLFEAIRCALRTMVAERPAVVLLDDVQASDEATLELLATLAPSLHELPLLVVAAYRSDDLVRSHPLRRLRHDLRREGELTELSIDPLDAAGTALLAGQVLGEPPSPRLADTLHARTGGVPFFVEELTAALAASGRLKDGPAGPELALDADVPLPQTIRDAVLVQTSSLSEGARRAAEAAAALGSEFDLDLVAGTQGEEGLGELLAAGLVAEAGQGRASFRHPLTREALYDDIPWLRRRDLHRRLAQALEDGSADPAEVATHWLGARDAPRALEALLAAAGAAAAVHAYRDAARLLRQALDLWPEGERAADRLDSVERYAAHAELAGDLGEAARAQREVVAARRAAGAGRALADAERRIAGIYALQGDRDRAMSARRVAAEAYAANGLPGEAAAERLVIAGYLQSAGRHAESTEVARTAGDEAVRAERIDIRSRAMGLQGVAMVKGGDFDGGIEIIRAALALALEHELTAEAAEVYQRLGSAHEVKGDYGGAREALGAAIGLCRNTGEGGLEQVCMNCMAYVLRELGDWDQALELGDELIAPDASPDDTLVADGIVGSVLAWRGRADVARPLLERCLRTAMRLDVISMLCDSAATLAWLAAEEGDHERASELGRLVLERWGRSEDRHYAVWGLRWTASHFAQSGSLQEARGCAEALSAIAADSGHPDGLAALAHALGETALAEGDADAAAQHLGRAVELHEHLDIPFERAQILMRAGVVAAAVGERETGIERLAEAHRIGTRLGAASLTAQAAQQLHGLGASLEESLGARAAARHANAGLSRRELEVVRLVADGLTNREIAARLVLSTRTVDMHVRSILNKFRCRTRTEAAGRAAELGLLTAGEAH